MNESADYLSIPWRTKDRFLIEAEMVRRGGYIMSGGVKYGCGKYHHFKAAMTALWPHFDWHIWSDLLIKTFAENQEVGIMGPVAKLLVFNILRFGAALAFAIYAWSAAVFIGVAFALLFVEVCIDRLGDRFTGEFGDEYDQRVATKIASRAG